MTLTKNRIDKVEIHIFTVLRDSFEAVFNNRYYYPNTNYYTYNNETIMAYEEKNNDNEMHNASDNKLWPH